MLLYKRTGNWVNYVKKQKKFNSLLRTLWVPIFIGLLTVSLLAFQNCSGPEFKAEPAGAKGTGNGDGFEGKPGLPVSEEVVIDLNEQPDGAYDQVSPVNSCQIDQTLHTNSVLRLEFLDNQVSSSCIDSTDNSVLENLVQPFLRENYLEYQPFHPDVLSTNSKLLAKANRLPEDGSLFCRRNTLNVEDGTDLLIRNINNGANTGDEVFDFQSGGPLPAATLFSRASAGTYWNQSGVLATAANDQPRQEFDKDGSSLGLLLESAGSNLLLRSNEFSDPVWSTNHADVAVASSQTGADGGSVYALSEHSTNQFHYIEQPVSMAENSDYVLSTFAKPLSIGRSISVRLYSIDGTQNRCTLNFESKTLSSPGDVSNCWFEELPNGWFRVSVRRNSGSQGGSTSSRIKIELYHDTLGGQYAGTGHPGVLIFGAQLEQEVFATSYIATGAAVGTRAGDFLTLRNGAAIQDPVSAILDYGFKTNSGGEGLLELVGAGAGSGQVLVSSSTVDSTFSGTGDLSTLVNNDSQKLGISATASNFKLFAQGAEIRSGSMAGSGIAQLRLSGNKRGFYLKRTDVYRSSLPDSQMLELTNPFVLPGQPHVVLMAADVNSLNASRVETAPISLEDNGSGVLNSSKFYFELTQLMDSTWQLVTRISSGDEITTTMTCYTLE